MTTRLYLVAYDIASPKRWRHVQKAIRRLCQRKQLSVFVCRCTAGRIARLECELRRAMHPHDDRLMVLDLGPAETAADRFRDSGRLDAVTDLKGVAL